MPPRHINSNNISFLGVSSGACAPFSRGKIGAEKGYRAIKNYSNKKKYNIFKKGNAREIISSRDLYDYIVEFENYFFNDILPRNIKKNHYNAQLDTEFTKTLHQFIARKRQKIVKSIVTKYKFPLKVVYDYIKLHREEVQDTDMLDEAKTAVFARHIRYLAKVTAKIRDEVAWELGENNFPFILAGDHSTAAGSIAGIRKHMLENAKCPYKKLGIIWIDAHVDGHTPYSSPSGNMHGMPVGLVLGLNKNLAGANNRVSPEDKALWKELCTMHSEKGSTEPMVKPDQVVYIGVRSWEPHEEALLKQIKHFKLTRSDEGVPERKGETFDQFCTDDKDHMRNHTLQSVCRQTIEHLQQSGCDCIYISFDIDSIDGNIVPGTGTPVDYGLGVDEAKFMLNYFWNNTEVPLVAMEMVEVNPLTDVKDKTVKVACEIIKSLTDNK